LLVLRGGCRSKSRRVDENRGTKNKPPAAFAGPPGSGQKARVNSAAKPPGNARKWINKYDL
jgi:hypothetical protein